MTTVLLHELGHAIGLDHSHDPNAVMYAEYSGPRSLTDDDIAGCQSLYGATDVPTGDGSAGGPAATPSPAAPSGVTAVSTTTIRVRSGPGTDYALLGTIPVGTVVAVVGRNIPGDWLYIDFNGLRGWVAAWLFTINGDLAAIPVVDNNGNGALPNEPTPSSPTGVTGVATTRVRMRAGPGTTYPTVGSVPISSVVNVIGKDTTGTWLYVDYAGRKGWVATWLFVINGDLGSVPILTTHDKTIYHTSPGLRTALSAADVGSFA
jgi:uncharacterized protein YraI